MSRFKVEHMHESAYKHDERELSKEISQLNF